MKLLFYLMVMIFTVSCASSKKDGPLSELDDLFKEDTSSIGELEGKSEDDEGDKVEDQFSALNMWNLDSLQEEESSKKITSQKKRKKRKYRKRKRKKGVKKKITSSDIRKSPPRLKITKHSLIKMSAIGSYDILKLYIQSGVNINAQNGAGDTALIVATRKKRKENIRLLLKYGADMNIKNKRGKSALDIASTNGTKDLFLKRVPSSK